MKKRLIGAVVLIALAVIFVPMLLPRQSDSGSQAVSVRIPPEPSGDMQTRILKVGPDGASAGPDTAAAINDPDRVATLNLEKGAGRRVDRAALPIQATHTELTPAAGASATMAGASSTSAKAESSVQTVAKVAPVSAPASSVPAPSAAANTAPLPGGAGAAAGTLYTVNLGIYADRSSADKLVANAKQQGFAALASPETYQGKPVMRVRVGPFASRAEAEAARLKLKSVARVSMTIDTGTVNQAGNAPASAIAPGQPGGWAVQLAAFSDQASADKLRDRLRGEGFDGYVDSVTTAKGKLWRVRAGPFASREGAATSRGQIAQKLKIQGDIVTE